MTKYLPTLLLALALTGLVGYNLFLLAALRYTDPASVGVVVGCIPIALALAGPITQRRRPQSRPLWAAVIVSAGAAVVQAASFILANLVCRADYHLLHPIHVQHVATSTRGVLWVQSVVEQAFARNAPCIIVADIYPKSGAMTPELLYEVAANALAVVVSGGHPEGVGSDDGAAPNGTGLEVRWMAEVAHAAASQRLTLGEANELVLQLLSRYEHVFTRPGGNPGVRFDRAYDLATLQPLPAWLEMYQAVKNEVRRMGLTALE